MAFEDDFILFLDWCNKNKKYCITHESKYWSSVTKMMHELGINYSKYGQVISLYVLQLEKEFLELKEIEKLKQSKKKFKN